MSNYIFYYNKFLKNIANSKSKNWVNYIYFMMIFTIYYTYKNWIFALAVLIILAFFPGNFTNKIITFLITGFSAYFFHRLAHESEFMNKLCGHYYHHKEKVYWYNHLAEFISDILAAGGYLLIINYIISKFCKVKLSNPTIIYFMIAFPLVHLFNYHYFIPKSYHYYHHQKVQTNFSPDLYDHLLNTNDGPYFENLVHMVPIFTIVGISIILYLKFQN